MTGPLVTVDITCDLSDEDRARRRTRRNRVAKWLQGAGTRSAVNVRFRAKSQVKDGGRGGT